MDKISNPCRQLDIRQVLEGPSTTPQRNHSHLSFEPEQPPLPQAHFLAHVLATEAIPAVLSILSKPNI